jgi:hypothetical protein
MSRFISFLGGVEVDLWRDWAGEVIYANSTRRLSAFFAINDQSDSTDRASARGVCAQVRVGADRSHRGPCADAEQYVHRT